jgi:hypothetical protein
LEFVYLESMVKFSSKGEILPLRQGCPGAPGSGGRMFIDWVHAFYKGRNALDCSEPVL